MVIIRVWRSVVVVVVVVVGSVVVVVVWKMEQRSVRWMIRMLWYGVVPTTTSSSANSVTGGCH